MFKNFRFTLFAKILAAFSLVSATLVIIMMLKASSIISDYVLEREKILNLDIVQEISKSIANATNSVRERTTTIANNLTLPPAFKTIIESAEKDFRANPSFVNLEVWGKLPDGKFNLTKNLVNPFRLESFGFDASYLTNLNRSQSFPLGRVFAGETVVINTTPAGGVPLINIGYPFRKNDTGEITEIILIDIDPKLYTEAYAAFSSRRVYVIDGDKNLIAYNAGTNFSASDQVVKTNPAIEYALQSNLESGQKSYTGENNGQNSNRKVIRENFSAFSRTPSGLYVFSDIDSSLVAKPARQLRRDITYIALSVISLSLLVLMFVSSRFTTPIEEISKGTLGIAQGNFDIHFQSRSNDEVGDLCNSLNHMVKGLKERDHARTVLQKFHGEHIAEKLMTGNLSRQGKRTEAAILFIDMRNFTDFSEKTDPEEVVKTINSYFDFMVEIIHRHGGVTDKFIGDAVMAVWGLDKTLDCNQAVKAALEIRANLEAFNQARIEKNENPIFIGMGLNTGEVVSGIIGSEQRMEYTVIGNTVNVAARVQGATKGLGVDLLITQSIVNQLNADFVISKQGDISVRGVSESISTYTVAGYKNLSGEVFEVVTPYSKYTPSR